MKATEVYDTYWRFAVERQLIYERRLEGRPSPWTTDPILRSYRFTNVYRASDRVSQYLIKHVQYRADRSQAPAELFFRTMLFKFFNKIETWEYLEENVGLISWHDTDMAQVGVALDRARQCGQRIYSPAYIMPSPALGSAQKHKNHLALLRNMMADGLPDLLSRAKGLRQVYELLLRYPGIGPFLAFQYAIDLNYSSFLGFDESDFVVAGPGAVDGISKCFSDLGSATPEDVIYLVYETQTTEFAKRGYVFGGLFGRPLQPIDCQNLFCEIAKYSRVAHPEIRGCSGRARIKQSYAPETTTHLDYPMFPPRWRLDVAVVPGKRAQQRPVLQRQLF
jgi:5-hmdU DNA kinase-like protein